jgi:hypothetical protein
MKIEKEKQSRNNLGRILSFQTQAASHPDRNIEIKIRCHQGFVWKVQDSDTVAFPTNLRKVRIRIVLL